MRGTQLQFQWLLNLYTYMHFDFLNQLLHSPSRIVLRAFNEFVFGNSLRRETSHTGKVKQMFNSGSRHSFGHPSSLVLVRASMLRFEHRQADVIFELLFLDIYLSACFLQHDQQKTIKKLNNSSLISAIPVALWYVHSELQITSMCCCRIYSELFALMFLPSTFKNHPAKCLLPGSVQMLQFPIIMWLLLATYI